MKKKDAVTNELIEDKAKKDAAYEYNKDSAAPVLYGALKGGLGSGIVGKFISPSKKVQLANLALGALGGAVVGKIYNDKKVDRANAARKFLSDERGGKTYEDGVKSIYKQSSVDWQGNVTDVARNANNNVVAPKKKGMSTVIHNAQTGALMGAGLGALLGKNFRLVNAAKLGGAGAVQSLIGSGIDNVSNPDKKQSKTKSALTAGASFGLGAAVDPIADRIAGRYVNNKDFIAHAVEDAKKGNGTNQILEGYKTKGKALSSMFKGLAKPTLKVAGKWGLIGAGLSYGLGKLEDHLNKKNQLNKQSQVSFTAQDAVKAKEGRAKEIIGRSRAASVARKAGIAGLAYVVGDKMFGPKTGKTMAQATLTYSIPKLLLEERDKHLAKDFLSKSKNAKLADIKDENKDSNFGSKDIIYAYTGIKAIDYFTNKEKGNKKRGFKIEDQL